MPRIAELSVAAMANAVSARANMNVLDEQWRTELGLKSSYLNVIRELAAVSEDLAARTCDLSRRLAADGAVICPPSGAPRAEMEPDCRAPVVDTSAVEPIGEHRTDSLPKPRARRSAQELMYRRARSWLACLLSLHGSALHRRAAM
jgi:hypothetical protein